MWIILRFENEYDQYGGYFYSLHKYPPNEEQSPNGHFGRKGAEYTWYICKEVVLGAAYPKESEIHIG